MVADRPSPLPAHTRHPGPDREQAIRNASHRLLCARLELEDHDRLGCMVPDGEKCLYVEEVAVWERKLRELEDTDA